MTQEQIEKNIATIGKLIDKYITSDRKEKVLELLEKYGEHYYLAPASTKTSTISPKGCM
jgi:hypothetical protein